MKIVLINYSGNVGKTTLAVHLFSPRMGAVEFVAVETVNASDADTAGLTVAQVQGKQFEPIFERLLTQDNLIIDVGASNAEAFMLKMGQYEGAAAMLDLFVVPVVPGGKQQMDTMTTIDALALMQVPKHKIRVVFNRADPADPLEVAFRQLLGYAASGGKDKATFSNEAIIYENEVYEISKYLNKTVEQVQADPTDYRALLAKAQADKDGHARTQAVKMLTAKALAGSAQRNLNEVYQVLTRATPASAKLAKAAA